MRRKYDQANEKVQEMNSLFNMLHERAEAEAVQILKCIRENRDVSAVLRLIKDGDLLVQQAISKTPS